MTSMRKIAIGVLLVGTIFVGFAIWYNYEYSMTLAEAYELNTKTAKNKLLIATQGSEFKDNVTEGIIERVENDNLYIKVIDISGLNEVNPKDYNAIVIIHTWENWQPPESVETFIKRTKKHKDKIIVLTTSGDGTYKMDDVDAITGESRIEEVDKYIIQITNRLKLLLNSQTS